MKMHALGPVILLLGAAGVAQADQDDGGRDARDARVFHGGHDHDRHDRGLPSVQAPEIDPASMVAALTLLGGALVVLRGRRAMKTGV